MKKLDEMREILSGGKWHIQRCEILTYDKISSIYITFVCHGDMTSCYLAGLTESCVQKVYDILGEYNLKKHNEMIAHKGWLAKRFEDCYGVKL